MEKLCRTCLAFCEEFAQCRLHPLPIEVHDGYWCCDWQAKAKAKVTGTLPALTSEFEQFWAEYPRKIGKKAAQKAFQNAQDRPRIDDLLEALRKAKRSPQWLKENGQFIPHPATWLNRGQWADVPTETKPSVFEEFLARGAEYNNELQ